MLIPPDLTQLRHALEIGEYTEENVSRVAARFSEELFDERLDENNDTRKFMEPVIVPGLHSAYLYEIVSLLLEFGLDPNAVYDGKNIMRELKYVDNEYLGADTLALLLEHGGRADLTVDGETNLDNIDFDIIFGAYNQRDRRSYDAMVHSWFVYIGYGGKPENGTVPLNVLEKGAMYEEYGIKKFELSDLKSHRNFTFGLAHFSGRGENWSLCIFDKRTRWQGRFSVMQFATGAFCIGPF